MVIYTCRLLCYFTCKNIRLFFMSRNHEQHLIGNEQRDPIMFIWWRSPLWKIYLKLSGIGYIQDNLKIIDINKRSNEVGLGCFGNIVPIVKACWCYLWNIFVVLVIFYLMLLCYKPEVFLLKMSFGSYLEIGDNFVAFISILVNSLWIRDSWFCNRFDIVNICLVTLNTCRRWQKDKPSAYFPKD